MDAECQLSAAVPKPFDATVYIVDDDRGVQASISRLVESAGFRTECCVSAEEFLARSQVQRPGCLVLDIRLPGMSGLELQEVLNSKGRSLPIIFITAFGDVSVITQAIRSGAMDLIPKPFDVEALLRRIHEAIRLDVANQAQHEQIEQIERCITSLTEREREVMYHLAAGESAKEIAHRLEISAKTVDNHRAKVLEKMLVDNPTQLARKLGLLRPKARAPFDPTAPQ